jgi:uncharacterized membrane protein
MGKKVKIRYNHDAGESSLKWRVVIDGTEYLASNVDVLVPSVTTDDFIEGVGKKFHISCEPEQIVWDGDKVILKDKVRWVSHKRHILKSLTYRIYSSCITSLIAAVILGDVKIGFSIGTADFFIKIFTYYIHERIWYNIPFGIQKVKKERL